MRYHAQDQEVVAMRALVRLVVCVVYQRGSSHTSWYFDNWTFAECKLKLDPIIGVRATPPELSQLKLIYAALHQK